MELHKLFRLVSALEGISLLLLLFVAMPLKYALDKPESVRVVGMAHGVLFLLYVAFACVCKVQYKWKNTTFAVILIASVLPFGTFYSDRKYLHPFKQ